MAILLIFVILLVAQFVPVVNFCIFGQPKLECKPCICHPECHCETKCVQQPIMKECNLGVDSHNVLASHHSQENRTTRIILVFSLIINFIQTLLLLFRKTVRNCYRAHQTRKRQQKEAKQQASARYQAERYTVALKQILPTLPEHPQPEQHSPQSHRVTSDEPLISLLSNLCTTSKK